MTILASVIDHYHRLLRSGNTDEARSVLALALDVPEYRAEAQMLKGVEALRAENYPEAMRWLSQAAEGLPQRSDIPTLMGRAALAQDRPEFGLKLLEAAALKHPTDPILRILLWQTRAATQSDEETAAQMQHHLPYIESGEELRHVLHYLQNRNFTTVGTVRYDAGSSSIVGWAINLQLFEQPASLQLHIGTQAAPFTANSLHPSLSDAGYPVNHGAFRIKLPPQRDPVRVTDAAGTDLPGSPLAITSILPGVPRFTSNTSTTEACTPADDSSIIKTIPTRETHKHHNKTASNPSIVNVLIPVYAGLEDTLACINSVLRYRNANRTPHQIMVLNDASPDIELCRALDSLARRGKITHIVRPANLGFIRNINRGMALHQDRDVVWLNADALVHGDWIDRLRYAAYAIETAASACPLSNNGELLSVPEPLQANPMPTESELAQLDTLLKQLSIPSIEIETGCGFCLYIKRSALNDVGYLDEIHLQRGYGEETDWCIRAKLDGWKHVAAANVFVAHRGGISFGSEKQLRVWNNNRILKARYPTAERKYRQHVKLDALKDVRLKIAKSNLPLIRNWMRRAEKVSSPGESEVIDTFISVPSRVTDRSSEHL